MSNLITDLSIFLDKETFYWFCALLGSGLFIIQFALTFIGLDAEDMDDTGADAGNVKWLSRQALTGFLMMFGWTALTCRKEFNFSAFPALAVSLTMGVIAVFISGYIFNLAKKLQSPGSVFKIEDTIGKEAFTYQRIPQGGIGKISLSINEMTQEIDAIAQNREEVPPFTRIKIVNILDSNTVIIQVL